MQGTHLRDRRVAAGVSYPQLARSMGNAISRVVAIERANHVSDPVVLRYLDGLRTIEQDRTADLAGAGKG
jgi:ribosome-binding protein aMBF1 (putative translation factor)